MAFVTSSAFMALDPRVTGALAPQVPALVVVLTDMVLYLLAAGMIARWLKRDGWGRVHRFALAAGAALTGAWCGLVFTGRDALDLIGQAAAVVLAIGILALAARQVRQRVEDDRGDGVQADLQANGGLPPRPGGRGGSRWVGRPASQVTTLAGSDDRGQYDNADRTSLA